MARSGSEPFGKTRRAAQRRGGVDFAKPGRGLDLIPSRLSTRRRLKHTQDALALCEARYRAVVDTAVDAIIVITEAGRITAFNAAAEKLFGYTAQEAVGAKINLIMPPPDREDHDAYLQRYRRTGERHIIGIGREVKGRRKDGSILPLELSVAEWWAGGQRYFTGVMHDITERSRAAEQRLMINELNHRVKNTMATVQAVVAQTLRNAADIDGLREALTARLLALADAHDALTAENWDGASLLNVVAAAANTHCEASRFTMAGPDARLPPKAAMALAMGLHELFTNAHKYGALSYPEGRVILTWGPVQDGFLMLWREQGGPPVAQPPRRGFGSRMLQSLARDLNGEADLMFIPDGLRCEIRMPRPEGLNEP